MVFLVWISLLKDSIYTGAFFSILKRYAFIGVGACSHGLVLLNATVPRLSRNVGAGSASPAATVNSNCEKGALIEGRLFLLAPPDAQSPPRPIDRRAVNYDLLLEAEDRQARKNQIAEETVNSTTMNLGGKGRCLTIWLATLSVGYTDDNKMID